MAESTVPRAAQIGKPIRRDPIYVPAPEPRPAAPAEPAPAPERKPATVPV